MKCTISSCTQQVNVLRLTVGSIAVVALIFSASIDFLVPLFRESPLIASDYHAELIIKALHSNTVVSFFPIVAALPMAGSYLDDIKNKFALCILIRTDCMKYLISRILVCYLSGGAAVITGILLAWSGVALLLFPMEKIAEVSSGSSAILLKTIALIFLDSGLWALVGMAMSSMIESQYIAYASPFVIYYLLVILCERYLPNVFPLYPPNWTNPDAWPFGALGVTLFLLELTAVCGIVFILRAWKRLQEL